LTLWNIDAQFDRRKRDGGALIDRSDRLVILSFAERAGSWNIPPKSLPLFEMVVNAVHKAAPSATIAFNTRPEDTAEAAARQLNAG
jgi:hypothetical protein